MNVLQLVTTDDRTFFLDQVRALERNGVNCDVIAASPGRSTYTDSLGPISKRILPEPGHNIPYYAVNAAYGYPRILKQVLKNDYDLIHVNSGLAAPYGLLQPGRPVVQTFWGSDLMGNYLKGQYPHVCRFCARRFDAAIVRNEAMRSQLGTDAHIIPAGVDMEKFKPMPRCEALEHVGWDPNSKHVLFPSDPTVSHGKRQDRKNYQLAQTVTAHAAEQLADPVELQTVSGVPHDEMLYYMNAADVLLLTSKLEGSPNTVKEALACNLPVVSTDVGDVRKRLRNVTPSAVCTTETELVAELVDVLEHGGRSNGRTHVEEVSWDRMAEKIIQVYNDVT
jgi:glycosyltransferase involved in cell wall biosynthesis